jgi:hypothetical protein
MLQIVVEFGKAVKACGGVETLVAQRASSFPEARPLAYPDAQTVPIDVADNPL